MLKYSHENQIFILPNFTANLLNPPARKILLSDFNTNKVNRLNCYLAVSLMNLFDHTDVNL